MHELDLVPVLLSHFLKLAKRLTISAQNYIIECSLRSERHICEPFTLLNQTNAVSSHDFSQFKCLLFAKLPTPIFNLSRLICKTSDLKQLSHSLPLICTAHARVDKFQNMWFSIHLCCFLHYTSQIKASVCSTTIHRTISQLNVSIRLTICQNGALNTVKSYLLPIKIILLFD